MSGCLLTNTKSKDCSTTSKIGGLKGRLWLYNIVGSDDLAVTYTETSNNITDITFAAGDGLYFVEGEKFAHNFTYALSVPGINKYYTQGGTIKTLVDTGNDIEWLDSVNKATSLGVIYENTNKEFIVLGQFNGLKAIEGDQFDSGLEASAEIGTTITLQGEENKPFKKFFDTDYETTLAKIISLQVTQP